MMFLLRSQSIAKPLPTVMSHVNKKGMPDHNPFYNKQSDKRIIKYTSQVTHFPNVTG